MGLRGIEVSFSQPVELTDEEERQLVELMGKVCERYERDHPDRVMWPAGIGFKPTYIPMTREEEEAGRHMEFDEGIFSIECFERENYDFPCTKCGKPQGDHKHCIVDPPAGNCEFSATQ